MDINKDIVFTVCRSDEEALYHAVGIDNALEIARHMVGGNIIGKSIEIEATKMSVAELRDKIGLKAELLDESTDSVCTNCGSEFSWETCVYNKSGEAELECSKCGNYMVIHH